MNKRNTTYFLLVASLVIWGIVAWRMIKTFKKDLVVVEEPRFYPVPQKLDSLEFLLNYDDPFLKEITGSTLTNTKNEEEHTPFNDEVISWQESETVQEPAFTFKGILKVEEKTYALLDFDGETIMVNQHDVVDNFNIVSIAPDKLVVRKHDFDIELYAK